VCRTVASALCWRPKPLDLIRIDQSNHHQPTTDIKNPIDLQWRDCGPILSEPHQLAHFLSHNRIASSPGA
jgi:hypothetical protein